MEKHRIIDFVVISLSVVVLLGVIGYTRPLVISPIDNLETTNATILFSFDKADIIMIDEDSEFKTPMVIDAEKDLVVSLKPGKYYWKIEGALESKVHTLTIVSTVDLRLRENNGSYEIVNGGNTNLDVDIYNNSILTGKVVLDVSESEKIEGDLFLGRELNEK